MRESSFRRDTALLTRKDMGLLHELGLKPVICYLRLISPMEKETLVLNQVLKQRTKGEEDNGLLETIPGIGYYTSLPVKAEIGDVGRVLLVLAFYALVFHMVRILYIHLNLFYLLNKMVDKIKTDQKYDIIHNSMWKIYLDVFIKDASLSIDEMSARYSHDEKMIIDRMEKIGIIYKNIKGEYLIVDEKKYQVVLLKIFEWERTSIIRYAFFMSFLITSLVGFAFYLNYLPQNTISNISFSIIIIVFSLFFTIIELLVKIRIITTLNYVFRRRVS